jgi:thiamine biosynthesis lipoprotein
MPARRTRSRRPPSRLPIGLWTICLALAGCARESVHQDTFFAMSSYVEVRAASASEAEARRALQAVRAEVERLEGVLSDYRPESNVSRLNTRQTDVPEPETLHLLQYAQRVCHETDGAFDVSLGPIKHLWGFGGTPRVPAPAALDSLIRHVGCDVYAVRNGRIAWLDDHARIDLGGIAQGFVAGRAGEVLEAHGITSYLVDMSGDIVTAGRHPSGRAWRIGIQHPRAPDSLLASVALRWRAVTTSGDYETAFFAGGVRYHHVFDPASGWPVRGVASVSVFSDDPIAADCYATALFVMGPERGLRFAAERPDLEAFVVADASDSLSVRWSSGLDSVLALQPTRAAGRGFSKTKNPSASSP